PFCFHRSQAAANCSGLSCCLRLYTTRMTLAATARTSTTTKKGIQPRLGRGADMAQLRTLLPLREALRQLGLGDDDHALIRYGEATLPVMVQVVADCRVGRDLDLLVDNGPANAAMPADIHAIEQDGAVYLRPAIDADVRRQDASADVAAAN